MLKRHCKHQHPASAAKHLNFAVHTRQLWPAQIGTAKAAGSQEEYLKLWREEVLRGAVGRVQDKAGHAPHPLQSLLLLHAHMVPAFGLASYIYP